MSARVERGAARLVAGLVGGVVLGLSAAASARAPAPPASPASPSSRVADQGFGQPTGRRLVWTRAHPGAAVEVTSEHAGPWLDRAQREVGRIAARLDALRTAQVHVAWTRLAWIDGRVEVTALADSGLYANVALLAVRGLYPKRPSAGSGVQQISGLGPGAPFPWRTRVLLGRPGGGRVIHVPAGRLGSTPPTVRDLPSPPPPAPRCGDRPRPGVLAPPGTPQGVSRVPSPPPAGEP